MHTIIQNKVVSARPVLVLASSDQERASLLHFLFSCLLLLHAHQPCSSTDAGVPTLKDEIPDVYTQNKYSLPPIL